MISRRLSKIQKVEILEAFRAGETASQLAEKYDCSTNTITRTVKSLVSLDEYTLLKEKKSKINKAKNSLFPIEDLSQEQEDSLTKLIKSKPILEPQSENIEVDKINNNDEKALNLDIGNKALLALNDSEDFEEDLSFESQNGENLFEEIPPLISSFGFDSEKQKVDCQLLGKESLPDCVYMLVDKKVELEALPISDLPEWSFLPENELKRFAILLFPNQRSAKRNCSRNQRVIKIPNTNVFKISKSYLLSKGITRLILQDSLISLED